jgi:cytochrome c oxidase subunit 2
MWGFEPSTIYIPAGSDADIYLTSNDVVHGCFIEEKAMNMMAVPGAINKTSVHFDQPGIYRVVCHEYCGTGHANMQSEIIVNTVNN